MKIKDGFFLNEMGDGFIVVAMNAKAKKIFNGMIRINSTGAFLWNELSSDKNEDELVKSMCNRYSVDDTTAKEGCEKFLKQLREVNLLDE